MEPITLEEIIEKFWNEKKFKSICLNLSRLDEENTKDGYQRFIAQEMGYKQNQDGVWGISDNP
jgi:hypothetical protein